MQKSVFSSALIQWGRKHGRTGLPWQIDPTPYRVWVSEIMLQQTQVATVIPYYERFMVRFPSVQALAQSEPDEVMHHWSGLGYYARGRNLHKAAKAIVEQFDGCFPTSYQEILALPGIGRSTAGAVLSLAMGQRYPILDGNVKRVFARFFAVDGWPGHLPVQKRLWQLVEDCLPEHEVGLYHQSLMDLGATLCSRRQPTCAQCPLEAGCRAAAEGVPDRYPTSKPKKDKPVKQAVMLLLHNGQGQLLLEARPASGVWGGLWAFPEFQSVAAAEQWANAKIGRIELPSRPWSRQRYTFSHYHFDVQPLEVNCEDPMDCVMDGDRFVWYNTQSPASLGLAAPVKQMIDLLQQQEVER